jgi:hypothetical protein
VGSRSNGRSHSGLSGAEYNADVHGGDSGGSEKGVCDWGEEGSRGSKVGGIRRSARVVAGWESSDKSAVWAADRQDFEKWKGFVESRILGMLFALEGQKDNCYRGTPFPVSFLTPGENGRRYCGCFFIGLPGRPRRIAYLNAIVDQRGGRVFVQQGSRGEMMESVEISIAEFRAMMMRQPYVSQLPWNRG